MCRVVFFFFQAEDGIRDKLVTGVQTCALLIWGKSSDQYPGYDKMVASILATTPDKIVAGGGAFVGTPEDVAGQIRGCVDAFGAIEPSMQINFCGSTDQEAVRNFELFASKVVPLWVLLCL